jgi:alpha-tubulin suppressor-like RCC1 family protein
VRALLVIAFAGCGRIGFGELGGDAITGCQLDFDTLVMGHESTIGVAHDGSYWGFGANMNADLSLAGTSFELPQPLPQLASLHAVALDFYEGTGIAADGTLWGWGGGGTTPYQRDSRTDWSAPSGGWAFGCALHGGSQLACWGDNFKGNLGDGTNTDSDMPVDVTLPPIASFSTAEYLACAIDTSGSLWCWGQNEDGQVGIGAASVQQSPPVRVGTDTDWAQITAGGQIACARKTNGTLWCWGQGYFDGTTIGNNVPAQIGTRSDWIDVVAHFSHTCGLTADRALWCFGENRNGQLGLGAIPFSIDPAQVPLPGPVDSFEVGGEADCAVVAGTRYCWGATAVLGIGRTDIALTPFVRCP